MVARLAIASIGSSAPLPTTAVDPLVTQRTVFSEDRTHRFTLFRHWGNPDDYACGISMNPSGAAEDVGDPTVNGMVRRARCSGSHLKLDGLAISAFPGSN